MLNENSTAPKWAAAAAVLIPAIAAAIMFANSLRGDFVYDDNILIVSQPLVRDLSALGIADIFTHQDFSRVSPHFLPIRLLSYAVDYRFWGMNPFGYHLTNLLLHVLNSMLAVLFIAAVAAAGGIKDRRGAWTAAGAAGLLFAVHPLQSESVAWISGRKELLCTGFLLCAALCYLRGFRRPASKKTDWTILCGATFFSLGMLSKASASAFPLALVAFEFFLQPGEGREKPLPRFVRLAPFFIADAVILYIDIKCSAQTGLIKKISGDSIVTHYLTSATIPLLYLGKALWPARLSVEYSAVLGRGELIALTAGAVVFWAALIVFLARRRQSGGAAAALAVWAVAGLAPVMGLLPGGKLIADRYFYLPSAGLFGAAGIAIWQITKGRSAAVRAAACALLIAAVCALGARTVTQNKVWRGEIPLWTAVVRMKPRNALALQNLGYAYYLIKDYDDAEKYIRESIRCNPEYPQAYVNLGVLEHEARGRTDDAIALFKKAIRIDPKNTAARSNLATAYFSKGEYQDAVDEMIRAIDAGPEGVSLISKLLYMNKLIRKHGAAVVIPQAAVDRMNKKLSGKGR